MRKLLSGTVPVLILALLTVKLSAQNPLIIPDTLSGNYFQLTVMDSSRSFRPGPLTATMGVNGAFLGPTLFWNKGDTVTLHVDNQLMDTTTMHWHGIHLKASNDGGPHTYILPDSNWSPRFPVLDEAATYWYHPHLHHKTDEQVTMGIAGLIIIRDSAEAALNLPRTYGTDDIPLVLQSRGFDAQNQFLMMMPGSMRMDDSVMLVNGTRDAFVQLPAQVVRLRILNGAGERVFNVGFSDNRSFYQIASDGGLLGTPVPLNRVMLAPGERAEILVDFSAQQGQNIQLMSYASEMPMGVSGAMLMGGVNPLDGVDFSMLDIQVTTATTNPVTAIPSSLVTQYPISPATSTNTRIKVLSGTNMTGPLTINGLQFDMAVINDSIPINTTEIWRVQNISTMAHPFHIHGLQFYMLERDGNPPEPNEAGRKDNVLILPNQEVRLIMRFENYTDTIPYMYHCHILHHEDHGMMLQFVVYDPMVSTIPEVSRTLNDVRLVPNPVQDRMSLSYTAAYSGIAQFSISDILGRVVIAEAMLLQEGSHNINLSQLLQQCPSGMYQLKIQFNETQEVLRFLRQ